MMPATAAVPRYELRGYQRDAVASLFAYFEQHDGNPILALPTGAGKSVIQAAFVREVIARWPGERFLLLSHVKELLAQNAAKIKDLVPGASVGVYSAGLGRKETGYQVTVAGVQSAFKRAHEMGDISIVIVDECHLVSKGGGTMYRRLLDGLRRFCPHLRVIGMSATPWRLDSGPLIRGNDRIFTDIAYKISIKDLIGGGYLSPLVSAPTETRADVSAVAMRGGEFVTGELAAAVDKTELTEAAIDEVEELCADRKAWLVFCVSVDHARHVAAAIARRGYSCAVVVGDTPKAERDRGLADFKAGRLRVLVSVGVLTTGFDAPNADALINLRPTGSPGLWVQMVGRVSRLFPGKRDGLVLDFTDNTSVHGPVDLIDVDGDGNPKTSPMIECESCGGETPRRRPKCACCGADMTKPCPGCAAPLMIKAIWCQDCGWAHESIQRKVSHAQRAARAEILSGHEGAIARAVADWSLRRHSKEGKPDSVVVEYFSEKSKPGNLAGAAPRGPREWLCFAHGGYAAQRAASWWVRHGGLSPAPITASEALSRLAEIRPPSEIRVKKDGKFWSVV